MIVQKDEADYLLRQLNPYLKVPLRREQVKSGMAGLRPLVRRRVKWIPASWFATMKWNSDSSSGLISILGGK